MSLWKKFVKTILKLDSKYNLSAIIDVGALLAGSSLKDEIVPWINTNNLFNKNK